MPEGKGKVTSIKVGLSSFRSSQIDENIETIKSSEGNIYGWNFINPNDADAYVKFYDIDGGATVGTSTPAKTIFVPALGTVGVTVKDLPQLNCENQIEIAATTGLADSDTGAPASDLLGDVQYA